MDSCANCGGPIALDHIRSDFFVCSCEACGAESSRFIPLSDQLELLDR